MISCNLKHDCLIVQIETEIANSPQVIELQKRVKILQGKLDKQKEQTRVLGESLKARQKADVQTEGVAKGASAGIKSSESGVSAAVDSKVRNHCWFC